MDGGLLETFGREALRQVLHTLGHAAADSLKAENKITCPAVEAKCAACPPCPAITCPEVTCPTAEEIAVRLKPVTVEKADFKFELFTCGGGAFALGLVVGRVCCRRRRRHGGGVIEVA